MVEESRGDRGWGGGCGRSQRPEASQQDCAAPRGHRRPRGCRQMRLLSPRTRRTQRMVPVCGICVHTCEHVNAPVCRHAACVCKYRLGLTLAFQDTAASRVETQGESRALGGQTLARSRGPEPRPRPPPSPPCIVLRQPGWSGGLQARPSVCITGVLSQKVRILC